VSLGCEGCHVPADQRPARLGGGARGTFCIDPRVFSKFSKVSKMDHRQEGPWFHGGSITVLIGHLPVTESVVLPPDPRRKHHDYPAATLPRVPNKKHVGPRYPWPRRL
jgi:hypothetical protein